MIEKYNQFLELLNASKKKGAIKILYRGVNKEFAFNKVNLNPKHNTIKQFSERLFFYGEKSKYFWNNRLKTSKHDFSFKLNDVSDDFFKYIFLEFNKLVESNNKKGTKKYFEKNEETVSFFNESRNIDSFLKKINKLNHPDRKLARNYYLRILHQLGESNYKQESTFISSTFNKKVARFFSKNDIIINFWDLNFNYTHLKYDLPLFKGVPYKNQKEISVFAVILPHYIYSFEIDGKVYPNPAIYTSKNLEESIMCGFDINQDNFEEKLEEETNYGKGVETFDGINYKEIKNSP